jgi:hypothetical protein
MSSQESRHDEKGVVLRGEHWSGYGITRSCSLLKGNTRHLRRAVIVRRYMWYPNSCGCGLDAVSSVIFLTAPWFLD